MSFDLLLCPKSQNETLEPEAVERELGAIPGVQAGVTDSGDRQFSYQSRATGVYCSFHWTNAGESSLDISGPLISFNLNYLRPTFFALEAMPLVLRVADRLKLAIHNPQAQDAMPGEQPSAEELVSRWTRDNSLAVKAFCAEAAQKNKPVALAYCLRERLDYYWRYMCARESIRAALAMEDVFVPDIILLKHKTTSDVRLVAIWPDCIPTVFPEVDDVLSGVTKGVFQRLVARDRSRHVFEGLILFQKVKGILGSDLGLQKKPVNHYVYRRQPPRAEVKNGLKACRKVPFTEMEGVNISALVDVPLG